MREIVNESTIENQVNIGKVEELHIHEKDTREELEKDVQSSEFWSELSSPEDIRNLREKFIEVCKDFSTPKLAKYNRNLVEGKCEQRNYDERDISSLKFIIFDKCQERLIDFCEDNDGIYLTKTDIETFIDGYVSDAKAIINDKKKAHSYPNISDDFIKKMV